MKKWTKYNMHAIIKKILTRLIFRLELFLREGGLTG